MRAPASASRPTRSPASSRRPRRGGAGRRVENEDVHRTGAGPGGRGAIAHLATSEGRHCHRRPPRMWCAGPVGLYPAGVVTVGGASHQVERSASSFARDFACDRRRASSSAESSRNRMSAWYRFPARGVASTRPPTSRARPAVSTAQPKKCFRGSLSSPRRLPISAITSRFAYDSRSTEIGPLTVNTFGSTRPDLARRATVLENTLLPRRSVSRIPVGSISTRPSGAFKSESPIHAAVSTEACRALLQRSR